MRNSPTQREAPDAPTPPETATPFSIGELERGLQELRGSILDVEAFWNKHVLRFRQTALVALRETSDALLQAGMDHRTRHELEAQLAELVNHIAFANRYIAVQTTNCDRHKLN